MDLLIREAYSSSSYFAEETHHVSYLGEVYDLHGLVQCTPDCYRCLKWAYNETEDCCYGKSFALVYTTKCMLTYKTSFLAPPPPPPPPPQPPPFRPYSGNNSPDSGDSFSLSLKKKKKKEEEEEVQEREMSTTNIVESPTNKMDEHTELLEQSAVKLSQLEAENLILQKENSALSSASKKRCRFRTGVQPMQLL
ncbi:hypothetical protein F2Q69_00013724 [Brassica cretica]|uniref:Gnk2-homologous domain-containing protein n=1 Tax=Brassica cretica TaxID=69181 RepID=A0A8S9QXE2_BRACR|nr:hypothetical protein F2Q69_00013724 [Brassica cretica]